MCVIFPVSALHQLAPPTHSLPLVTHKQSLHGVVTIRAYGKEVCKTELAPIDCLL